MSVSKQLLRILAVILAIVICLSALFFVAILHVDKIVMFSVSRFSGMQVSYGAKKGNSLTSVHIKDLEVDSPKTGLAVDSENAVFRIRWSELFAEKKLVIDCQFEGVRFHAGSGTSGIGSSMDALIKVPLGSKWKYRVITFTITADKNRVSIRPFDAISSDVVVVGGCDYSPDSGDAVLDVHMSFSPDVSAGLMENGGQIFLTPENDGWYGAALSLEGNLKSGSFHMKSDRIEINIREVAPSS